MTARLSVNLHSSADDLLRTTAEAKGFSKTEGVRQAISLWALLTSEVANGQEIVLRDTTTGKERIILLQ